MTPTFHQPSRVSLTTAAAMLGVSDTTVRGYVRKHTLNGDFTAVTAESVEALRVQRMSGPERNWETHLARHGTGQPYVREYVFDAARKWRFDVAWPELRVAVALIGGTMAAGHHVRPEGYRRR